MYLENNTPAITNLKCIGITLLPGESKEINRDQFDILRKNSYIKAFKLSIKTSKKLEDNNIVVQSLEDDQDGISNAIKEYESQYNIEELNLKTKAQLVEIALELGKTINGTKKDIINRIIGIVD